MGYLPVNWLFENNNWFKSFIQQITQIAILALYRIFAGLNLG